MNRDLSKFELPKPALDGLTKELFGSRNEILTNRFGLPMERTPVKEKEKQIQEYRSKQLIDELSKMPPMVIATAYLHAINYTLYGEDVTEKWLTAIQNASALSKAYQEGYYDALQKQAESEDKDGNNTTDGKKLC